jgi:hypothetical protein
MSTTTICELIRAIYHRYRSATKKEKTVILNDFWQLKTYQKSANKFFLILFLFFFNKHFFIYTEIFFRHKDTKVIIPVVCTKS